MTINRAPLPPSLPPLQVSVQYTGGRGAPAAPPFGGKEGVMDLLVTENVFYGRDAQVRHKGGGGWQGEAAKWRSVWHNSFLACVG